MGKEMIMHRHEPPNPNVIHARSGLHRFHMCASRHDMPYAGRKEAEVSKEAKNAFGDVHRKRVAPLPVRQKWYERE